MAMDKLVAEGSTLTLALLLEDEEQYDKLATSIATKGAALPAPNSAMRDSLASIDPSVQTIAYFSAVAAIIQSANASGKNTQGQVPRSMLPDGELWPYMSNALLNFDPISVRYVGGCLTEIVNVLAMGAEQTINYIPAIQLLNNAILRLDRTSSTFSSTHYTYVHLCLRAGAFADALAIVDLPIYHIPGGLDKQSEARSSKYRCSEQSSASYLTVSSGLTQKITNKMVLEYNYMCALCNIAMGQYQGALFFLKVLLVAPTAPGYAHMIVVEAYRKWLLINLLVSGSVPEYPNPAPVASVRILRGVCKPYECLVDAFKFQDSSRLAAEISVGRDEWSSQNNLTLVTDVLQAHRKFTIQQLGRKFASIPVKMVDAHVPVQPGTLPTLNYLQILISQGELRATLTPKPDGTDYFLRFLPDATESRTEAEIETVLAGGMQQLSSLLNHVSEADHRMQISKEYVDMLKKLKKNRDDDNKKGLGGTKSTMPFEEMDEDMMGDEL